MLPLCTRCPEGVGSFRHPECYDFVRTDQRGWDLLDFLDGMALYALTRGGGILQTCWTLWQVRADQGVGSSRLPGCYDFVRADQKGWGLLDVMGVMTLYALTRGGGIF